MTATAISKTEFEDVPDYGPAMKALAAKRQAFVCAMFDHPKKVGRNIYAARAAGYGKPDGSSTDTVMKAVGWRIAQDETVQAAIVEECQRRRVALTPTAVNALEKLLENPKHKDHARGIAMVLDRTDPLQTTHTLKIEDTRPPSPEVTQKVLDRIEELMKSAGLIKAAPTIDGEFKVVGEAVA